MLFLLLLLWKKNIYIYICMAAFVVLFSFSVCTLFIYWYHMFDLLLIRECDAFHYKNRVWNPKAKPFILAYIIKMNLSKETKKRAIAMHCSEASWHSRDEAHGTHVVFSFWHSCSSFFFVAFSCLSSSLLTNLTAIFSHRTHYLGWPITKNRRWVMQTIQNDTQSTFHIYSMAGII